MGLGAPTIIWLECPLRHNCSNFLLKTKATRLAANVLCVKEREGYQQRPQGLILLDPACDFLTSPQKKLKNNRLETIHTFGTFQESPKFASCEKVEKTARRKFFSTLWNSLASGVSLC